MFRRNFLFVSFSKRIYFYSHRIMCYRWSVSLRWLCRLYMCLLADCLLQFITYIFFPIHSFMLSFNFESILSIKHTAQVNDWNRALTVYIQFTNKKKKEFEKQNEIKPENRNNYFNKLVKNNGSFVLSLLRFKSQTEPFPFSLTACSCCWWC